MKMGADAPILDRHQARQNIDYFNTIRENRTYAAAATADAAFFACAEA